MKKKTRERMARSMGETKRVLVKTPEEAYLFDVMVEHVIQALLVDKVLDAREMVLTRIEAGARNMDVVLKLGKTG